LETLDSFLYDLARVAAEGSKVPVGGYVDTRGYNEFLKQTPAEQMRNPHQGGVSYFYSSVIDAVTDRWPKLQWPISFFFDQTEDLEWRNAITAVHQTWKGRNSRIKEISFADKKDPEHYPLQAADLVAYRLRQIAGKFCKYDPKIPDSMPKLDRILFGKFFESDNFGRLFPIRG
jgi:hypothetical protein